MSIEVLGIDHCVLRVSDMARALRFYGEVLGCHEERRLAELGLVQLRAGHAMIDLVDKSGPLGKAGSSAPSGGRNMDHLALRIAEFDEAALRAHLLAHGVEPGAIGLRYGAEGSGPSIYIQDPDGNTIELKGPPAV